MLRLLILVSTLLTLACSSGGGDDGGNSSVPGSASVTNGFQVNNCNIPSREFQDGGPGKDGIPAILDPIFKPFSQITPADLALRIDTLVLVVEINGDRRAYPEIVLWNHEVVNDHVGGVDIVVSYCPLTGSAVVFERFANELFRVSGLLYESNLLMYDEATESLWPQMELAASCGDRAGEPMNLFPVQEMTVHMVEETYPDIRTLIGANRVDFLYGGYPYGSYDQPGNNSLLFPVSEVDDSLPIKSLTMAVKVGDAVKGYPHENFGESRVIHDSLNGQDYIALFIKPGRFAHAFSRDVGDQKLTFDMFPPGEDDGLYEYRLRDAETGTLWSAQGKALEGPLAGEELTPMINFNVMWFSFRVSFPGAAVWTP